MTPRRPPDLHARVWLGAPVAPGGAARPGPFARVTVDAALESASRPDTCQSPEVRVIAVDGGLKTLLAATRGGTFLPPNLGRDWLWVGDGDSLGVKDPRVLFAPGALDDAKGVRLATRVLPEDKDLSDFGAALDALETLDVREAGGGSDGRALTVLVSVEGGLGGRRDHELCNLLEAADFLAALGARGASGAVDFEGRLVCFTGRVRLAAPGGTCFSLCALRGAPALTLAGARYTGDLVLGRGSRGLSNVVAGAGEGSLAARVHALGAVFAFVCAEETP